MRVADILSVLDDFESASIDYWVAGGFGVAVLVGRVTREHRDLDLLVRDVDMGRSLDLLGARGYAAETDWLPVRIELGLPNVGWVDLHPLVFDNDGSARQAAFDGEPFYYGPEVFTFGTVDGRRIPCISERRQREFHSGYDFRPQDMYDLASLDALSP